MLLNHLQPPPAAGKPSKPRGNHPQLSVAISPLTILITLIALLSFGPTSASAGVTHKYESRIEGFSSRPRGVTVGPVGGEGGATEKAAVFVAIGGVLERFSAAGVPLPFECATTRCGEYLEGDKIKGIPGAGPGEVTAFGGLASVAVDDKTGEVFVSTGSAVDVFSSTGEFLSQVKEVKAGPMAAVYGPFGHGAAGLTFDQETGELYLANEGELTPGTDVVDVFRPKAPGEEPEYVRQFGAGVLSTNGGLSQTLAVAEGGLAEAGTVYVSETGHRAVAVFNAMGDPEPTSPWTGEETPAGSFGERELRVGMDPVSGRVYVADVQHHVLDEFAGSVSEEYLGRLTGTPTGPGGSEVAFGAPEVVTVSAQTGEVYVGDKYEPFVNNHYIQEGFVDIFGPDLQIPDVVANGATGVSSSAATLHGTVTLVKEQATCEFVWGTSASELTNSAKCEPEVVAGTEGEFAVRATVGGLRFGTTYYYKLQATNTKNEQTNLGEEEQVESFTTLGPNYGAVSVADVSSSSATFDAPVNPDGAPTSVFFEYGRCASLSTCASSAYEASTPAEAIGSGTSPVPVEQHVQGLTAGSVYHYRVAATSEIAPGEVNVFVGFEAGLFTTQSVGTSSLIDGRGYEMVSPPGKQGSLVQGPGEPWGITQAADTGEAFTFLTNFPTEAGVAGYSNAQQVLSSRTSAGWVSKDLASPHNGAVSGSLNAGQEYRFFNEELTEGVLQPFGAFEPCHDSEGVAQPCLSEEASEQTAFMANLEGTRASGVAPTYTPLVSPADDTTGVPFGLRGVKEDLGCPPEKFCGPFFDGATPDASHVVLHSDAGVPLTSQTAPEGGLYEWSAGKPADEQLTLVSVLPGGAPEWQSYLGSHAEQVGTGGDGEDARNAISADGSRVFWTSEANTLYMRDNATAPPDPGHECVVPSAPCTIQIGGTGLGGAEDHFQIASADGSRVFWSEGRGLYECEIPEGVGGLKCVPTRLGEAPEGGGSVIGASEDGSYVYWVSADRDLLVDHLQGGVWHLRQVAALSSDDAPDWADHSKSLAELSGRVSPDGVWVAFMSDRSLTGYDNLDAVSGQPDEEAYLYDAETQQLTCASCNPTGARPTGVSSDQGADLVDGGDYEGWAGTWLSGVLPGWTTLEHPLGGVARYQPRYLSNEGRLFFDSDDALVPKDIDNTWDVYEYEPAGVPAPAPGESSRACGASSTNGAVAYRPAHEYETEAGKGETGAGCVGLISSGESAQESVFLDASAGGGEGEHGKPGTPAGGDVFFMTTAKLAPQDFDHAYDIYDAHECTTASPCIAPPAGAAAECITAEACRAAPNPEPGIYGAPPSATFNGLGNLTPGAPAKPAAKKKAAKCKAGFVRRTVKHKSECIRKPKSKRGKAKR
jgi:hypothetical protein